MTPVILLSNFRHTAWQQCLTETLPLLWEIRDAVQGRVYLLEVG